MAQIKISVYDYQKTATTLYRTWYDYNNPTVVGFDVISNNATPHPPPASNVVLTQTCQPGTTNLLQYHAQTTVPYIFYTTKENSTFCGYVAPNCDIQEKTFAKTDETTLGGQNGTVNYFATSSKSGIVYKIYLYGLPNVEYENTTGYFTGVIPNNYTIKAIDSGGCSVSRDFTINAFDNTKTHLKYRLQFDSISNESVNSVNWDVQFNDLLNSYDPTQYPKFLTGVGQPLVIKQELSDEDKFSAIAVKQITLSLLYDGLTFTPDEFGLARRNSWYIEVYKNGVIDFKGYLLPDEVQDYYGDPSYNIQLTATDGLPSLKGNKWGDGSGANGYTTDQIPQFGLTKWCLLVKQCLDQLGYNYGAAKIVSSLQYNKAYSSTLWRDIGTWSDIMYGSDGVPNDTYNCLELLLQGMGLTMMQHKGEFIMVNWDTLYYADKPLSLGLYQQAFYEFSSDFSGINNQGLPPVVQPVGFQYANAPINPPQSLRFDKAYNIKASVDFDLLALLYPNPSFEIGSVEGQLPSGWEEHSPNHGYLHNEDTAYDGYWVFKIQGYSTFIPAQYDVIQSGGIQTGAMNGVEYIQLSSGFYIDQAGKSFKVSYQWRPDFYSNSATPYPVMSILLIGNSGKYWSYKPELTTKVNGVDIPGKWIEDDPIFKYAYPLTGPKLTDYLAWVSYDTTTPEIPELGTVYVRFWGAVPVDDDGYADQNTTQKTYSIDDLQISLGDASESYSKQTGENHLVNAISTNPETKEIDLSLFTYPQNKRVAGNIFTTSNYTTGEVGNKWSYALRQYDNNDRLAAVIAKGLARVYQTPFRLFEGEVQSNSIQFYGVFKLRYYDGLFMPYSIEFDCLNNSANIVIVGIDDSDQQAIYKYVPVYEKSARKNIS